MFFRQMPKTLTLHQSSQCLVLSPYRRYHKCNQAIAISKSNNPLNMCLFIILFNYWIAILSISDVSGLIIFYGQILTFIAGIYGWSRDLVRETIKKCNMVSVNVFIFGFTPFVISESILL